MSQAPTPLRPQRRHLILLLPLLLAGWAALDRCATSAIPTSPPGSSAPSAVPDQGALEVRGAPPGAPCPTDTLPDRGLCLPLPPVTTAGRGLPDPAAPEDPTGAPVP